MTTKTDETVILDCGHPESNNGSGCGTGYGQDKHGKRYCYACCAERDKRSMRETGRAVLYLTTKPDLGGDYGNAEITNWPGSLKLTGRYHKGSHNIARTRYDVWFKFEGQNWWGVTYGEDTQICHCKRVKYTDMGGYGILAPDLNEA
jgi:hypothetical protein